MESIEVSRWRTKMNTNMSTGGYWITKKRKKRRKRKRKKKKKNKGVKRAVCLA